MQLKDKRVIRQIDTGTIPRKYAVFVLGERRLSCVARLLNFVISWFRCGRLSGEELEQLGDCYRYWWWCGQMVADRNESLGTGDVFDADWCTVRSCVRVATFDIQV